MCISNKHNLTIIIIIKTLILLTFQLLINKNSISKYVPFIASP